MPGRESPSGHPALTDPSTGLPNRLHFEAVYRYLFEAADRGVALAAMMISVGEGAAGSAGTDRFGQLGEVLQRTTRAADLAAHLGDGRFVVLLIGTNLQGARVAADRLEEIIAPVVSAPLSIGLASWSAEMDASSELLDAAGEARRVAEARGGGVEMA